jgi:hypothetical protein
MELVFEGMRNVPKYNKLVNETAVYVDCLILIGVSNNLETP